MVLKCLKCCINKSNFAFLCTFLHWDEVHDVQTIEQMTRVAACAVSKCRKRPWAKCWQMYVNVHVYVRFNNCHWQLYTKMLMHFISNSDMWHDQPFEVSSFRLSLILNTNMFLSHNNAQCSCQLLSWLLLHTCMVCWMICISCKNTKRRCFLSELSGFGCWNYKKNHWI